MSTRNRFWMAVIVGLGLAGPAAVIGMPESIRIPVVVEHNDADAAEPALFSHWAHNTYKCFDCHPSIFPEQRLGFTHEDLDAGRYCGACHNDEIVWGPDDPDVECQVCHRE